MGSRGSVGWIARPLLWIGVLGRDSCVGQTTALFLGPEPATEVHLGRVIWSPWILLARLLRGEQQDGVFF